MTETPEDRPRDGFRRALLAWSLPVLALGGLTAWHDRRNPAILAAEVALARDEPLEASRRGLDAVDRRPVDPRALRAAARGLSRLAYAPEAETYYDRARRVGGLGPEDLKDRAQGWMLSNGREKAVAAYKEALDARPADPDTLRRLATLLWTLGRYEEALGVARRLEADPTEAPSALALQATIHHERLHPAEAVAVAEAALRLDPSGARLKLVAPILWAEYAADLMTLGRGGDARRHLEEVAPRFDTVELWDLLGRLNLDEGNIAEAERCLRASAAKDPNRPGPWLGLGRAAARSGRLDGAAEAFERAAALDPASHDAYYQLGLIRRRLSQPDAARAAEARAEQIRKSRPPLPGQMGAPARPSA